MNQKLPSPTLPGLLSLVPFAGFLWVMLYAYVGYLGGGHWPPLYSRPDPTTIGPWGLGYLLMGVLMIFLVAAPASLPLMLWVSTRRALRSADRAREWSAVARQTVVFAFGAMLFATELMRLSEWLMD